jgi:hypothetical protein
MSCGSWQILKLCWSCLGMQEERRFGDLASDKWWSWDKELTTSFLLLQNHWLYAVESWFIITVAVTLVIVRCNECTSPKFDFQIHPAVDMLSICERKQDLFARGSKIPARGAMPKVMSTQMYKYPGTPVHSRWLTIIIPMVFLIARQCLWLLRNCLSHVCWHQSIQCVMVASLLVDSYWCCLMPCSKIASKVPGLVTQKASIWWIGNVLLQIAPLKVFPGSDEPWGWWSWPAWLICPSSWSHFFGCDSFLWYEFINHLHPCFMFLTSQGKFKSPCVNDPSQYLQLFCQSRFSHEQTSKKEVDLFCRWFHIDKICTALHWNRCIVCPSVSPLSLPLTESSNSEKNAHTSGAGSSLFCALTVE